MNACLVVVQSVLAGVEGFGHVPRHPYLSGDKLVDPASVPSHFRPCESPQDFLTSQLTVTSRARLQMVSLRPADLWVSPPHVHSGLRTLRSQLYKKTKQMISPFIWLGLVVVFQEFKFALFEFSFEFLPTEIDPSLDPQVS